MRADIFSIDEIPCGTRVYQGVDGFDFHRISGFNADFQLQRPRFVLSGGNDESQWQPTLPMRVELPNWFRVWYVFNLFNRFVYFWGYYLQTKRQISYRQTTRTYSLLVVFGKTLCQTLDWQGRPVLSPGLLHPAWPTCPLAAPAAHL